MALGRCGECFTYPIEIVRRIGESPCCEECFDAFTCTRLFRIAAHEWERGNNSGDARTLQVCEARCAAYLEEAELILRQYGVSVDYPGLYPVFHADGRKWHTARDAIKNGTPKQSVEAHR